MDSPDNHPTARRPRVPRLFLAQDLGHSHAALGDRETRYLGRVLRLRPGDQVLAFNGRGQERLARILELDRRDGNLELLDPVHPLPEPALDLVLVQALLKADAMDLVIQKATELGVGRIIVVDAAFSVSRLDRERSARRLEHWGLKASGACEQSGRHRPPQIHPPAPLNECLELTATTDLKLLLHPDPVEHSPSLPADVPGVCIASGPEGGWSEQEVRFMQQSGFVSVRLGPRTLRAETAAVAGCTFAQLRWGDMKP